MEQAVSTTGRTAALRRALVEIRRLKAELSAINGHAEPIAIVGMACRFPGGADSPHLYWQALAGGRDLLSELPVDRWPELDRETIAQKPYLRRAGFLAGGIDAFDARLFRFSPKEAERTDPQQRLFLRTCWEALENALYPPTDLKGKAVGVYVGASGAEHGLRLRAFAEGRAAEPQDATGSGASFISGRAAYFFGFHGPAITIDTACSSSLVAIDQACKGLRCGDCGVALAGGVNLMLAAETTELLASLNILSPDCRVACFDASANGTVRGEGCGVLVLKRLCEAERDGDFIHAIIASSGANQDGVSSGLTAPYGPAQEALIREVWGRACLGAEDIDFIETHGTGTSLGDPIEVEALGNVLSGRRAPAAYIGSVKSVMGHLEAAAGVAGVIKAVLAVEHGEIPPNLHFDTPTPLIEWEGLPLRVPTGVVTWDKAISQRAAAVSSFGLSGTNAHVVIRGYDNRAKGSSSISLERSLGEGVWPFRFTALATNGFEAQWRCFLALLERSDSTIEDLSYSQNCSRARLRHEVVLWAKDREDLRRQLLLLLNGREPEHFQCCRVGSRYRPKVVFLFSGTGSQYPGMFCDYYRQSPVFREALDLCVEYYRELRGNDLLSILFSENPQMLTRVGVSQVALFAVEYALARMWMHYGVQPDAMIGHSAGEYVAACLAGVFDLKSAITLMTARGELLESLPKTGKMVVARASSERVARYLKAGNRGVVVIAAENSPEQTVVSGERGAVDALCAELRRDAVATVVLQSEVAFHSPLLRPMLTPFEAVSSQVAMSPPTLRLISNLTGELAGEEITDYRYWSEHLLRTVRFEKSILSLGDLSDYVFLEVGPRRLLSQLVETIAGQSTQCLYSDEQAEATHHRIGRSLFQLSTLGTPIDWAAYYHGRGFQKTEVPNYAFDEQCYRLSTPNRRPTLSEENDAPLCLESLAKEDLSSPGKIADFLRRSLAEEWQAAPESINWGENLLLRGLDSITMGTLVSRWSEALSVPLKIAPFFTTPTLEAWADYLSEQLGLGAELDPGLTRFAPDPDHRYDPFPLSDVQNAYWVGRNPELPDGGFSCYSYAEIDAETLDPKRFERALDRLIQRHEMLRAVVDETGRQRILETIPSPLRIYRREATADLKAHLERLRAEMSAQTLPLGGPLFDLRLSELGDGRWRIHYGVDFLGSDALSVNLFWRDLRVLYDGVDLPPLEVSFRDYVHHVIACRQSARYEEAKQYWLNRLDSLPNGPTLPVAHLADTTSGTPRLLHKEKLLGQDQWNRFVRSAAAHGLTPSAAALSLFAEVLAAWGAGEAFGIMLTVFERENVHPHIKRIIGDFTQLSLLAVSRKARSLASNAQAIQRQMQEDLQHVSFCAVDTVKALNQRHETNAYRYPVVFTSVLGVGAGEIDSSHTHFGEVGITRSQTPQVWLDAQLNRKNNDICLAWDFREDLFHEGVIDALFNQFTALIERAIHESGFWESELRDLRPESQRQTHTAVNQTRRDFEPRPLSEPIRAVAASQPNRDAVVFKDTTYSYRQLIERANQFSATLQRRGAQPGGRVAIQMSKSFDAVAAILGIVQMGAAYVPIPHDNPDERVRGIVSQSQSTFLLRDQPSENTVACAETLSPAQLAPVPSDWSPPAISPGDTAYIIFTSGSTGTPKGVEISHQAAFNTIDAVSSRFGVTQDDAVINISSFSFDLSVYDLFGLLCCGGKVIVPTEEQRIDPQAWRDLSQRHSATLWNTVPSLLELYVDYLLSFPSPQKDCQLKTVFLSGDWIPLSLPAKIEQILPSAKLISMGGATEASIWSNYFEVAQLEPNWKSIPYGYPLDNQSFYILDEWGRPCPDWVKGRLHIGGDGLAKSYWGDAAATQAAFFVHPTIGIRLYNTCDYGRYMENGIIEFLGRQDDQLKINGYRVELGDIQAAFLKIDPHYDPVIIALGEKMAHKKLVAFVKADGAFDEESCKRSLGRLLPPYCVPGKIIGIAAYPKSSNGKVDRKGLIDRYRESIALNSGSKIETETRRPVVEGPALDVMRRVFDRPQLSDRDEFSALGISSIDMIRLANELELAFGDRPSVAEMMRCRSVGELAAYYADKVPAPHEFTEAEPQARSEAPVDNDETAARTLLDECRSQGIRFWLEGPHLKFKAPDDTMTPELLAKLKAHKAAIIACLASALGHRDGLDSERFPLTPIQWAYVSGRSKAFELGNVGAHFYSEIECRWDRLGNVEAALNDIIRDHPALRAVIHEDGSQEVLLETPRYEVAVCEIHNDADLEAIRERWSQHLYPLGAWPMFHFEISRHPEGLARIHASIDLLIMDAWSGNLLMNELLQRLAGEPSSAPQFTFRQYMEAEKHWRKVNRRFVEKAQSYWREKLCTLPPAPPLPYRVPLKTISSPRFKRLHFEMDQGAMDKLVRQSREHQISPSTVVCTAFLKLLAAWARCDALTLNLTLFNRLPLHPEAMSLYGDFTNLALIEYSCSYNQSFASEATAIQEQIWRAVEHRAQDGLALIRELAKDDRRRAVMPVVFTSLFEDERAGRGSRGLPDDVREVYAISQTPQVVMDHHFYQRGGDYIVNWDVVEQAFDPRQLQNAFATYRAFIGTIVDTEWDQNLTIKI